MCGWGATVAIGALCFVLMMAGIARALWVHHRAYHEREAAAALAHAAGEKEHPAQPSPQPVIPVLILHPGAHEVCAGHGTWPCQYSLLSCVLTHCSRLPWSGQIAIGRREDAQDDTPVPQEAPVANSTMTAPAKARCAQECLYPEYFAVIF